MEKLTDFFKRHAFFCVLASNIIWSLSPVLIKSVPWSPFSIHAVRCAIAVVVLAVLRGTFKVKLTKTTLLGGVLMMAVILTSVLSNKLTTAANTIVIGHVSPAFVLIFSAIFYKAKPRFGDIVVVPIVLFGVALCAFSSGLGHGNIIGDMFALLCGISSAGLNLVYHREDARSLDITYLGFIFGACLFPSLFIDKAVAEPLSGVGIFSIVFLGVVQMGFSYFMFSTAIKNVKPLLASLSGGVQPVFAPIWALIFLHEVPGVHSIIGGMIIVAAVMIYQLCDLKRSGRTELAAEEQGRQI